MRKSTTDSFILELKLQTSKEDLKFLDRVFYYSSCLYNTMVKHAINQISKLQKDPQYQEGIKLYKNKKTRSQAKEILNERVSYYGLSEYEFHAYIAVARKQYENYLNANTAQKIATAVWKGVEKILYSNGKKLHFKKYTDLFSIEGKSNKQGIRLRGNKLCFADYKIQLQIPSRKHAEECRYYTEAMHHRVKYSRIVRRPVGSRFQYFLQIILEGKPPIKENHTLGTGNVGHDQGTSTIASVSQNGILLEEIGNSQSEYSKEIRRLNRKLDRSMRANNPDNYNENGTIKKGKKTWKYSKTYIKDHVKLRRIYHKKASSLKQWQEAYTNQVLTLGDEHFVETMNNEGLKRRKKKPEKSEKTGKFKRSKRFGKSYQTHAPSQLINIIARKLKYYGKELHRVNTKTFRASQYNHVTDDYVKKRLSKRHLYVNGEWIQRDLYSAFLLMNSKSDLENTDRNKCFLTYDNFKDRHDKLIKEYLASDKKYPSSFGLKTCKLA